MRQFLHKYANTANMQIPLWKNIFYFFVRSAISPARRDLFSLTGVPHARGMLCAQDDGRKRRVHVGGLDCPTLYVIRGLAEESGEA